MNIAADQSCLCTKKPKFKYFLILNNFKPGIWIQFSLSLCIVMWQAVIGNKEVRLVTSLIYLNNKYSIVQVEIPELPVKYHYSYRFFTYLVRRACSGLLNRLREVLRRAQGGQKPPVEQKGRSLFDLDFQYEYRL